MEKTLADNINDIIFIVNIIGGVATIFSIGIDILNRLSIHQQLIKMTDAKTNNTYNKTVILNWTKPVFWVSVSFFVLTGVCLLFSSIDFYRFMSIATFSILFFISIFLKLIHDSILRATKKLESFINEQNAKLSLAENKIEEAKKFIDDNKSDIHLSSTMAKIFASQNFK